MLSRRNFSFRHISINCGYLTLYQFSRRRAAVGFDIGGYHYFNSRFQKVCKNLACCRCGIISYVHGLCVSVVKHKIVLFEIKVIGRAVEFILAAFEIFFGKFGYLTFVCSDVKILEHFKSFLRGKLSEVCIADTVKEIYSGNIKGLEFSPCGFLVCGFYRKRDIHMLLDSVLTFLDIFLQHTAVVFKAEIEKLVRRLLHQNAVTIFVHVHHTVPQTNLTVYRVVKDIHKLNILVKVGILLFLVCEVEVNIVKGVRL